MTIKIEYIKLLMAKLINNAQYRFDFKYELS